ncbi:nitrite reductase/ring-hydroxylating ferredoxin subunit [Sinobacterium caligoides]|uniref:Nitrite reductase/ring-hydroxylating ferredoxin subunit n=1 Tax=Sinobacterium caligoides TaxID=933926 RepID=A0A3N2DGX8_9GAMM|nr:Rieske 2Fe-2S domain-containing protein [Sinobacterium caligoides]ROR98624.1 nitrite reductase/ring-hydroxylating ferredoxin subunit [Sinobacterium caligoides]
MPHYNHALCHIDEIEHESAKGFELNGINFFVVKRDNITRLYLNSCPHLGVPLEHEEDKFLDGDNFYIMCSSHGALFQPEDGLCIYGPCQGQRLSAVDFEIVDQQIMINSAVLTSS